MPAPAVSPLFATDATFAADGDPWAGDATRVDPGPSRRAEGFEPDTLPAEWLNERLGNHGDWIKWLDDELLASGSRVLRLGAWVGEGVDSTGSAPPFRAQVQSTGGTEGWNLVSNVNFAARHLDISALIPEGADLTGVRAMVKPGAARGSGDAMLLSVRTQSINWTTPAEPTWTVLGASLDEDDGTTAVQIVGGGVLSVTNTRASQRILARLVCGNDAGTNRDRIYGWEISYTGAKVR